MITLPASEIDINCCILGCVIFTVYIKLSLQLRWYRPSPHLTPSYFTLFFGRPISRLVSICLCLFRVTISVLVRICFQFFCVGMKNDSHTPLCAHITFISGQLSFHMSLPTKRGVSDWSRDGIRSALVCDF